MDPNFLGYYTHTVENRVRRVRKDGTDEKRVDRVPMFKLVVRPDVALMLKRMLPRVQQNAHLVLPIVADQENAVLLEWFMLRYPLEGRNGADVVLANLVAQRKDRDRLIASVAGPDYVPPRVDLVIPARNYQLVPAVLVTTTGGLLLADAVGVGKTASAIVLAATRGTLPMVYVTKTDLPKQIVSEFKRFAPALKCHIIGTGRAYKNDLPLDLARNVERNGLAFPDVVVMSYSKLAGWADWLAPHVKSVVYDEVQELRAGETTDKGSGAATLTDAASYRLSLSGTPIFNYGDEIHNVLRFTSPGVLGERDEFLREWCVGKKVTFPNALGAHLRSIGVMLRRSKEDVGRELPPLTVTEYIVEHEEQALEDVASAATEIARRIMAGGGRRGDAMKDGAEIDWRLRQATGISKARSVANFARLLVESNEKVLLYAWHHAVYDLLGEHLLDLNPVFFTGRETAKQREESVDAFKDGRSDILIMSLRSGVGLDGLQYVDRATNVVIGELDWTSAVHEQNIGRLFRDGQTKPVNAWYLVAEDGSDPIISEALGIKSMQLRGIRDMKSDPEILDSGSEDRTRTLAERYLRMRGEPIPERAPQSSPADASMLLAL